MLRPVVNPRWRKALRDLWLNRTRTFLVVLAVGLGTLGFGTVTGAYSILVRELEAEYLVSNPASATLWTDPFDQELVEAVRDMDAIADADGRRTVVGRVEVTPGDWRNIFLYAVDDFDEVRIGILEPEEGAWPPQDREILIERDALGNAEAEIGDTLFVKTPNGTKRGLPIVGTVHDVGQPPADPNGLVYGYVTLETLEWLGEPPVADELRIVVAGDVSDEAQIASVVADLEEWIEEGGRTVYRTEIPTPGEHPFSDSMSALLFTQAVFGWLALGLGGLLVVNVISSLLAQQIRQIGVMKAVGANTWQMLGLYLGLVLALGVVALAVSLPAVAWAAKGYAAFVGDMLNFDIENDTIGPEVLALAAGVGLLTPALVAALPIYRGARVTVREAIGDYGMAASGFGAQGFEAALARLRSVARPLLLSIRNTFRQRGRLLVTLSTLAVSGGMFIAAVSVRASMVNTVDDAFSYRPYDIDVRFARPYRIERVEAIIGAVPGVSELESWGWFQATRVYADGTESDPFAFSAPPVATELMVPKVIEGRWLLPSDENALVVNHVWADEESDVAVGDEVVLEINDRETTWQVVGVVREVMATPAAYANYPYVAQVACEAGNAGSVMVVTGERNAAFQENTARALERALEEAGIDVLRVETMTVARQIVVDHFSIITSVLLVTSILAAVVGGMGLMSTMSISVLERTREIGVMRSVGASTHAVLSIVVGEGIVIGLLSSCLAAVFAWPMGAFTSGFLGLILMQTPFNFVYSLFGLGLWLGIVVVFTAGASFVPAWRASRAAVWEALAYE
ncbi:MAG: FtsX-like permease family protein [Anaerolineae bacterium]|nr:FtsX-like permease family protein [Anaerolineae bacterium]